MGDHLSTCITVFILFSFKDQDTKKMPFGTTNWTLPQNSFATLKRIGKKWMTKSEAAKVIQRAFRNYMRRKLVKKLNKEIVMKFKPGDFNRRPRRDKVLELFNVQGKESTR